MRDYQKEFESRVGFIRQVIADSHASGIVFGNSGGKDSALVGILCKAACENTVGVIMPCTSRRNFTLDADDAKAVAQQYQIETRFLDLTSVKECLTEQLMGVTQLNDPAITNIAPRLRMSALYAIAASENRIVAGTGNRSEAYLGYFTKWGDGAHDFNPISDLTVTEIFAFLEYLKAPRCIIEKAPSAGLFDGQTDETEMGVTYAAVDQYLTTGKANTQDLSVIERYHLRSEHKRKPIATYEGRQKA